LKVECRNSGTDHEKNKIRELRKRKICEAGDLGNHGFWMTLIEVICHVSGTYRANILDWISHSC